MTEDEELIRERVPTTHQTGRIQYITLAFAMLACVGVAAVLFRMPVNASSVSASPSHRHGKTAHLPLLQAYIAWQPEFQAIVKKDYALEDIASDAKKTGGVPPNTLKVLSDKAKFQESVDKIFAKLDADNSG